MSEPLSESELEASQERAINLFLVFFSFFLIIEKGGFVGK